MLTAAQCETIAFYVCDAGEFVCHSCAADDYSELTLSKLEQGYPCVASDILEPVSRYGIHEQQSAMSEPCDDCDGSGYIEDEREDVDGTRCDHCEGDGYIEYPIHCVQCDREIS